MISSFRLGGKSEAEMRDNFTKKLKDTLARRAGMRCSNPNCLKSTSGPHDANSRAVNIGVACHIAAASPGGPRYNNTMTGKERKSVDNGIWLCQNCAKLIDSDEIRFSPRVLREWKRTREESARRDVEEGYSVSPIMPTLRVLIVTAEHPGIHGRFFEQFALKDADIIRSVLLPSDVVAVLKDANITALSQALMEGYDVVQFEAQVEHDGSLVLGDETVSPDALASVIGGRGIKCALFMTCNSANVIGALHTTDVACVIAATSNLIVDYCEQFCQAFYASVSKGFSLPEAFAHANIVSSQSLKPFRDLCRTGSLCISIRSRSNEELILRSPRTDYGEA